MQLSRIIIYLACLSISGCIQADFSGRVVKVTDGDSVIVLDSKKNLREVRLTGIDAPEHDQPFGNTAKEHLSGLVAGKQVKVESARKDSYGRDLGKLIYKDTDINLEQVKAGMAWWYRYYKWQQSKADRKAYAAAENEAKSKRLGLWSDPNPITPYQWRRNN